MADNLSDLMKQAQKMQVNLKQAQNELAKMSVTGDAGAGMVAITINGQHAVKNVTIDTKALEEDKDVLEDLIAAAFNDAVKKVETKSRENMNGLMAGMNLPTELGGE